MRVAGWTLLFLTFYSILVCWVKPRWALSLFEAGIFVIGAVFAWRVARGAERLRLHPVHFCLVFVLFWALLQLALGTTVYRWATWESLLTWSVRLTVFSLAFELAHGTEFRGRVLSAILYFGFSLSILAIVQNATSDGRIFWLFPSGYREFVLGPFVYRNHYAAFVELILPIALWRALKDPAPALPYATAAAVLHASVIAAASRSGFILASAELLAGLALLARHRGWCRPDNIGSLAAKFVAPLALCAALVGPGTLWARFSLPDPSRVRREVLLSTLSMVRDRPWLGFGLGTWPVVYRQYATFDDGTYMNQAHNDWAQWAAEGGLPMAAVMLAGVAATLVAASSSLWGLGVPVVFAHALVDYPFQQRPAVGAFVFLMLGLVAAESRDPRKAR